MLLIKSQLCYKHVQTYSDVEQIQVLEVAQSDQVAMGKKSVTMVPCPN